jgi:hypothetical protein
VLAQKVSVYCTAHTHKHTTQLHHFTCVFKCPEFLNYNNVRLYRPLTIILVASRTGTRYTTTVFRPYTSLEYLVGVSI